MTIKHIMTVTLGILLLAGCGKSPDASPTQENGPMKIRVGYIGLTCEAPIFTAVEKGFFKEENLDVTLVKCEWANYKDVLALGGFDVTHHLVMYFLKPIEQGLDVKFTAGIHRGCLRVQAATTGNIHSVEDLRGKRIGVPGMGTPPFIFANRVLGAHGIDPGKEIHLSSFFQRANSAWRWTKARLMPWRIQEPIGTLLTAGGKVKNIAIEAADAHLQQRILLCGSGQRKISGEKPQGRRRRSTTRFAQRRKMGRGQPSRRRQNVGREKISGFRTRN